MRERAGGEGAQRKIQRGQRERETDRQRQRKREKGINAIKSNMEC